MDREHDDLDAFRLEVREWMRREAPAKGSTDDFSAAHVERADTYEAFERLSGEMIGKVTAWQRRLDDVGWGALGWPGRYGGRGPQFQKVLAEEQAAVGVTTKPLSIGVDMVGPTLIAHGTDGQCRRYLAPIRRGDEVWCQLFSEPEAGSDLPSLRMMADRVGDAWNLRGQKLWTSGGSFSNFGLALARTDRSEPRHAGISAFIVDMSDPGVEVRPLRQMSGAFHFNEVFLNDVLVPDSGLVGELHGGWDVARTMLHNERSALGGGTSAGSPEALIELARQMGRTDDPVIRALLAELTGRASVLQWTLRRAEVPGGERLGGLVKLLYSDHARRMTDAAVTLLGPRGIAWPAPADIGGDSTQWVDRFLFAPGLRIAGGSDEIQRNTIGERLLGLDREPPMITAQQN